MFKNGLIIKNLVIRNLKEEFKSYKWIFFIGLFFILNLIAKIETYNLATSNQLTFNWWDVLYNIIQNQYYVIYLFFPLFLYVLFKNIKSNLSSEYIIRHVSRKNFIISKIITVKILSLSFILIIVFISLIGSVGLDFYPKWSSISIYFFSDNIVNTFSNPIVPILLAIILLSISFTFISIISILGIIYIKPRFAWIPSITIWVTSLLGIRLIGNKKMYEFAFLNTNMLLHQAMSISSYGFILSFFLMIILSSIMIYFLIMKIESIDFK